MTCSQCHTGRAWDAQGRCRPCSIGNVNLGAPLPPAVTGSPGAASATGNGAALTAAALAPDPAVPAVHSPTGPAPSAEACSQCWIGVAWDEEGRCRPCSEGGVRLVPEAEADPEEAADDVPPATRFRRWFGTARP